MNLPESKFRLEFRTENKYRPDNVWSYIDAFSKGGYMIATFIRRPGKYSKWGCSTGHGNTSQKHFNELNRLLNELNSPRLLEVLNATAGE